MVFTSFSLNEQLSYLSWLGLPRIWFVFRPLVTFQDRSRALEQNLVTERSRPALAFFLSSLFYPPRCLRIESLERLIFWVSLHTYLFECMSLVVDTSCTARPVSVWQAAPHLLLSRMFAFDKITLGSSVDKVHSLFFFECLSSINHSITLVLGTSVYSGLLYTHLTFSNVWGTTRSYLNIGREASTQQLVAWRARARFSKR